MQNKCLKKWPYVLNLAGSFLKKSNMYQLRQNKVTKITVSQTIQHIVKSNDIH